jgi:RNA polymerase sigma factor (sigma-70 family)
VDHPLSPEELLLQARWMRPLAQRLVGESHAAEDVVQESMAAALERRPDARGPLAPWLARVVRNVALRLRRDEARLAERHALRAKDEAHAAGANGLGDVRAGCDPLASLERLDTQQMVLELVRGLDEPLRATIVLRYFEGLSSAEIARRTRVPDATVRWREQRALQELRARLERRLGSRDAWCALLAPLAEPITLTSTTTVAAAAAGAIAMGSALKLSFAAAALAVVGAGMWMVRESPVAEPLAGEAPVALEDPRPAPQRAEPVRGEAPSMELRAPVAGSSATGAAAAPAPVDPEAPPVTPTGTVKARFVDSAGNPWERVSFRRASEPEPAAVSGPDGRVALELPAAGGGFDSLTQLVASRPGCALRTLRAAIPPGGTVDLGELVLEREARIRGVVRNEQGQGLAEVQVGLSPLDHQEQNAGRLRRQGSHLFDHSILTRSKAGGVFELAGVPAGAWRLWGQSEEGAYGVSEPFEVLAGEEELDADFVVPALRETDVLTGVVLDPSGVPVAGAEVMLSYEVEHESGTTGATTDAQGKFQFLLMLETPSDLVANDPDRRWGEAAVRGVPPGARDIVLQLGDPASQPKSRLRVSGPQGEAVSKLELHSRAGRPNSYSDTHVPTTELEPGVHEFSVPMASFGLEVIAEGYIASPLIPFDPAALPDEVLVRLEAAPVIVGLVRAKGLALAGAVVEAQRAVDYRLTLNGFPCRMSNSADAEATSGQDGQFRLSLESRQPVYLRCTAAGHAPTIVGPIRVDVGPAPVTIDLGPGGSIEGRVLGADGSGVAGVIVGITNGDGHPRTLRSGHDGKFRFDTLAEGSWLVLECEQEFRTDHTMLNSTDGRQDIEWSCEVQAGRTTYHDLVLKR